MRDPESRVPRLEVQGSRRQTWVESMHRSRPHAEHARENEHALGGKPCFKTERMEAGMTNQEINERVARLCGWVASVETIEHNIGYQWTENRTWWSFSGRGRHLRPPNYAESLDACRSFEDLIENSSDQEIRDYIINLEDASNARGSGWDWRSFRLARATPLQRCEAFLRLKGQWE